MAMDPTKKRKLEENGFSAATDADSHLMLTPADARKIMERFTPDQLLDILQDAAVRHADVLASVRAVADPDVSQRKLFIRGLGWDTTTDGLRNLFSAYGDLEEAIVILDKATGKSKGYGFVTFRHVDGALLALREPSKRIDGRITVTQLAAAGNSGAGANAADVALRKIYVANVPPDLPADKLLAHFSQYGEIEEGPLGFDKQTGKSKGFALFVYKSAEGAQASLMEPVKTVDGRQLNCKLASTEGKQGKRGGAAPMGHDGIQGHGNAHCHGDGMVAPSSVPGQFGGPVGGLGSYGSFTGGMQGQPPMGSHLLNSSVGGLGSVGSQAPPNAMGGAGGYGSGMGGHYGGYAGPGSAGFAGIGSGAVGGGGGGGGLGGGSAGGLAGGAGALGGAGSIDRLPGSGGMPGAGYPWSGHYSLSASGYQNQHHPPSGASPVPRVPPGSMYPNVPPYY